jgi:arsenite methyltransferase
VEIIAADDRTAGLTTAEIAETVYRLDGPLRWALAEVDGLLRDAGVRAGMSVVDLGAGTGYAAIPAATAVGPDGCVYCVDNTPQLLDVLDRRAAQVGLTSRLRRVEACAVDIPLPDGCADMAVSTYVLHELADLAPAALAELYRVLRPTGTVAIADYRKTADPQRNCEIEAWYARQHDAGGADERHLRFTLDNVEVMLASAGFRHIHLSTWNDFHVHAIAIK